MKNGNKGEKGFSKNATGLLKSIDQARKGIKKTRADELSALGFSKREKLKLVRQRTKAERKAILERYEKASAAIGKSLLVKKKEGLMKLLSLEKRSLGNVVQEIVRVKKIREDIDIK
jgi:hypothetical protein